MTNFSIRLLDSIQEEGEEKFQCGIIIIGDFQEYFLSSLSFWSASDYNKHWHDAVFRLVSGSDRSALITDMYDPYISNCIEWWTIYNVEDILYIQNSLLALPKINEPFDLSNPFRYVPERRKLTEEGEKISEWSIPLDALKDFYYHTLCTN
jgi:CdiI N-terminal domain